VELVAVVSSSQAQATMPWPSASAGAGDPALSAASRREAHSADRYFRVRLQTGSMNQATVSGRSCAGARARCAESQCGSDEDATNVAGSEGRRPSVAGSRARLIREAFRRRGRPHQARRPGADQHLDGRERLRHRHHQLVAVHDSRSCLATAATLASCSQSITIASNSAVNRDPGSPHGTRTWCTPCSEHGHPRHIRDKDRPKLAGVCWRLLEAA
jgi:hypothetical protein